MFTEIAFALFFCRFSHQLDRYFYLVDLMLSAHQPVLLVGPSGVGKSSLVQVSKVLIRLYHCQQPTFPIRLNRSFPSCFEPHYESEAKCEVYIIMKISFHSYANKSNFHMKSFA